MIYLLGRLVPPAQFSNVVKRFEESELAVSCVVDMRQLQGFEMSAKVRNFIVAIWLHAPGGLFHNLRRLGSGLCDPVISFLRRVPEDDHLTDVCQPTSKNA